MNYQQYHKLLFVHLITATLFLAGCNRQIQKPERSCPGSESAIEALSVLKSRSQNMVPFKANGQCRLEFYVDGKPKKENFPVQVWLNPPADIYIQGDVAFDPRGIVLGSNENKFWLAIKLKDVSSYWLGNWAETGSVGGLLLDPRVVLEALGIIALQSDREDVGNWSLSKEGVFDVLTRQSDNTGTIKKLYADNCDYSVRKIQYLNIDKQFELVVELDKFEQVVNGFSVPSIIRILRNGENLKEPTSVCVSLTSIKPMSFGAKQQDILFNHPEQKGFKHVFVNVDGRWIEQKQD